MKSPRMIATVLVVLVSAACSTPASKENNVSGDAGSNSSNNSSADMADNTGSNSANNDPVDAGVGVKICESGDDCAQEEVCQSSEEASWNFCGAPMEPTCEEGFVGDSCGHCFQGCTADVDCDGEMTCNGTYCITARTCFVPSSPPP